MSSKKQIKQRFLDKEFNEWVVNNHRGEYFAGPPEDWDREKEFFYRINLSDGALQYRIKFADVPEKFWERV